MKQRIIAFALALAVVFAASFALWSPERLTQAALESADSVADEWVGFFLVPFQDAENGADHHYDGKYWAVKTADGGYDFGIAGSACFVTVTEITPDAPSYEPNSRFNFSIGSALGESISSGGMNIHVNGDDNEARYEITGTLAFADAKSVPTFLALDVYRTSSGEYYAEEAELSRAFGGNLPSITCTRSASSGGETRTISVSLSFEIRPTLVRAAFTWLDAEKTALSREEYAADALPSELTPPSGAALLLVTQTQQTRDGLRTARTLLSPEDELLSLYPAAEQDGLLRVTILPIRWAV